MPAEPARGTVHQVQHLLLDGLRILRARTPAAAADVEVLAAIDRAIAQLEPMEGFPIEPVEARLYGLAHGLRTLAEDVLPYIAGGPVDASEFPATLKRLEDGLRRERDGKAAASG